MDDSLNNLKQHCHEKRDVSLPEKIALGEMTWIKGRPAAADDGTIALRTSVDIITIIREQDIHAVRQQDEEFLVQVATGTNVLVRLEKIAQIRPRNRDKERCDCGTQKPSTTSGNTISRNNLGGGNFGGPGSRGFYFPGICEPVCAVAMECVPYGDNENFCVPIVDCWNTCP